MKTIISKIKHTIRGFKNLKKWFKVIWNDRDFDHYYLYVILEKKLSSIEETFSDVTQIHQIDESRLHIVKYVKIARILINRLMVDDFNTDEERAILNKIELDFVESEDDSKLMEIKTLNSPPIEVLREIIKNENQRKNKTRKLFFLILDKRLERWWD
jgi:hypothetical protein